MPSPPWCASRPSCSARSGPTGHGHGSAKAVVLGLEGEEPATVDTDGSDARVAAVRDTGSLLLAGTHPVFFDADTDLVLHRRRSLPAHANGMVFRAFDGTGAVLAERTYYSVGGGFVVDEAATGADRVVLDDTRVRFPFTTGDRLLEHCAREGMRVSDVVLANDASDPFDPAVRKALSWTFPPVDLPSEAFERMIEGVAEVAVGAVRTEAALPLFAPQTALGAGALGTAQAADREIARLYAVRARALAEFAADRPASADRAQGEPGAMSPARWAVRPELLKPVSEWATQEAAIGLTRSQGRAEHLLDESLTLTARLPGTLVALEGGLLTAEHLRPLLEHVAPIADPRLRAEIETDVLAWVADRAARGTITVPAQLAERVLRVVTRRNARDAAQKALRALRDRGVFRQRAAGEGLAGLGVVATVPEVEALHAALSACVDALPADPSDTRSRDQRMLDVLCDLVLRPGANDVPPVQVTLTLVAGVPTLLGGDQPAELGGAVVSAETARQLLNALTGAGLGAGVLADLRDLGDEPVAGAHRARGTAAHDHPLDDDPLDDDPLDGVTSDGGTAADGAAHRDAEADAAWLAATAARLASGEIDLELDTELLAAQLRWEAELAAGLVTDPDPPADRPDASGHLPPPTVPPPASGWWVTANRALADASAAQCAAEQAVARAGRLVRTAVRADADDEAAWRQSPAGRVDAAEDAVSALHAAAAVDRAALHDLLDRTGGGGLAGRPRIALVDALSGVLVSLTELPGLRRAAHCGRPACRRRPDRCDHDLTGRPGFSAPPPTDGYRPGAELDRFIRLRDRRCRWPGCRKLVCRGEIDHRIRWPDGSTAVTNLAGLCPGDHRGKHQAPGVTVALTDEGTLVVTTPSGITATTDAPPF